MDERKPRMTKQKRWIFAALTTHPLSVDELFVLLKKKQCRVDKTTIYRNLEKLVAQGIASVTHFADKTAKYELARQDTHHHHIVCTACGHMEDVELDEHRLTDVVKQKTSFGDISHRLEFFGTCKDCR